MSTVVSDIRGMTPRFSGHSYARQLRALMWQALLVGGVRLSEMPILEHLEELRTRLLRSVAAIAVGMAICFAYTAELIQFLGRPAAKLGIHLVAIDATEIFSLYFRVAATGGICLATPFIVWQIWRFIEPALHSHERRYAGPFVISTTLCFVGGAIFGYAIVSPWFFQLQDAMAKAAGIEVRPSALSYFETLSMLVLSMGAIFEMPPVVFVLSRIGLVSARFLVRNFKYAFLLFSVAAAVLTPSTQIPPMLGFLVVITAVYVVSILVALIFGKSRKVEG